MARFWLAFFIINLIVTAAALISCLSAEEEQIKSLPRIVWVIIILLFSPIGAIAYFVAGRERAARSESWPPGSGSPQSQRPARRDHRPVAPDDDPEFLRQIGQQKPEDNELMRKWEEDLKRREEELRKRDQTDE
jgi:hypothetical protein